MMQLGAHFPLTPTRYVYYWEENYPQSPTVFALRGDRYKYVTYYGIWDADELYHLKTDPDEMKNLFFGPHYRPIVRQMEDKLYGMMGELGGMEVPLNQPKVGSANKRLRSPGVSLGHRAESRPEATAAGSTWEC